MRTFIVCSSHLGLVDLTEVKEQTEHVTAIYENNVNLKKVKKKVCKQHNDCLAVKEYSLQYKKIYILFRHYFINEKCIHSSIYSLLIQRQKVVKRSTLPGIIGKK